MLNPVLQHNMLPEHMVLYNLKLQFQDDIIRERIVHSVQHIRKTNRRNGVNKLEVKADKYGNNGGWYFERVRHLVKNLYKIKPISKEFIGLWRSIEFELIFKSKEALEEFTYATRVVGISDLVTIQNDQSIKTNHQLGIDNRDGIPHEVVVSYRAGNEDVVQKFCQCLKGRAYVNYSCGTHFHFDMRHMTEEQVTEYGERIGQAVPALRLLLPKDRRESKFQKITINTTKTPCVYPHKYAFVNLAAFSKHKTMEIRGHSGTINSDKILNWIALCEMIMIKPKATIQLSTVDSLIETYKLDKELTAYVKERATRFEDVRTPGGWSSFAPRHSSEEEEKPAENVDVSVHPAFMMSIPKAKKVQANWNQAHNNAVVAGFAIAHPAADQ
jgi:hypothetical protein